jgi:hypothetical protein
LRGQLPGAGRPIATSITGSSAEFGADGRGVEATHRGAGQAQGLGRRHQVHGRQRARADGLVALLRWPVVHAAVSVVGPGFQVLRPHVAGVDQGLQVGADALVAVEGADDDHRYRRILHLVLAVGQVAQRLPALARADRDEAPVLQVVGTGRLAGVADEIGDQVVVDLERGVEVAGGDARADQFQRFGAGVELQGHGFLRACVGGHRCRGSCRSSGA